jgi:hypothetical protein
MNPIITALPQSGVNQSLCSMPETVRRLISRRSCQLAASPREAGTRLAPRPAQARGDHLASTQRPRVRTRRRSLAPAAAIQSHRREPGRPSPCIGLSGCRHAPRRENQMGKLAAGPPRGHLAACPVWSAGSKGCAGASRVAARAAATLAAAPNPSCRRAAALAASVTPMTQATTATRVTAASASPATARRRASTILTTLDVMDRCSRVRGERIKGSPPHVGSTSHVRGAKVWACC